MENAYHAKKRKKARKGNPSWPGLAASPANAPLTSIDGPVAAQRLSRPVDIDTE
jgi:hypothetical protein